MKKLIAISVMLVVLAGAVFAEVQLSASIETRFTFITGDTRPGTNGTVASSASNGNGTFGGQGGSTGNVTGVDPFPPAGGAAGNTIGTVNIPGVQAGSPSPMSSNLGTGYVFARGQSDDGTIGGSIRVNAYGGTYAWRNFIWWKPIDQIKVFLGQDADGLFSTGPLTEWGFHQGAEGYLHVHDWGFWRGIFPGNWDNYGLAVSLYLVDGLEINMSTLGGGQAKDVYPYNMQFQAVYGIQGTGKIFLTYKGAGREPTEAEKDAKVENNGNISASFLLTAVDGLQVHVGFSTQLRGSEIKPENNPLNFGLAAHYSGEGFGVKFRSAVVIHNGGAKDAQFITGDIMPWYNFGAGTVYLDFGIAQAKPAVGDAVLGWWLNPYVRVPIGSGGSLRTGVLVMKNQQGAGGQGSSQVKEDDFYRITFPMILGFSF